MYIFLNNMYTFTQIKISNMYHAKWSAVVSMAICWNWCFSGNLPASFQDCFARRIWESSSKYIILLFLLSKTFSAVQENSDQIWKYERYNLVFEYHKHTGVVPPFPLLSQIWLLTLYIYSKFTIKENKPLKKLGKVL